MNNLKPCPFCGCGAGGLYIVTIEQHGFNTLGIFCNGCKQTVLLEENEWEGDNDQSRKKAIKAWNRRAEKTDVIYCRECAHRGGDYCHYDGRSEFVKLDHFCGYGEREKDG